MPDLFPSISVLVPKLKVGDQDAWNELVEKFTAGLVSKARCLLKDSSLKRRFSPEDLAQEAIRKAWQQHHRFQGESTAQFAKWMLSILRNTFLDHCRSSRHEPSSSSVDVRADNETPSKFLMNVEQESQLHACLAELDPEYREILSMRYIEELKYREIAERLEANINTVAGICKRGLDKLTRLMSKRADFSLVPDSRND